MLIVWSSRTGNLKRFMGRLARPHTLRLLDGMERVREPFLLLTYTASFGDVPREVAAFLEHNAAYLRAVVGSGNRNWGTNYCRAAYLISERYRVPVLQTFELSGMPRDLVRFQERLAVLQRESLDF